jgi:hypothetical protein
MTEATVLTGGRIFTGRRYVEAMLVEGATVVAAGSETEVRRDAPTGSDRRSLGGCLVVPGLADAHLHLGEISREREALDVRSARSIGEVQALLRAYASARADGPLAGRGLDLSTLREGRWPTASELDAAVPDRPAVLLHASGHAAVANSPGLEAAFGPQRRGLPEERRRAGLAVEEELGYLRPTLEEALPLRAGAVERTLYELLGLGLTRVGTMNASDEELGILSDLDHDGRLPAAVRVYRPSGLATVPPDGRPAAGRRLAVVGVKAFLDGAFGPRTAALTEPYADDPTTCGVGRGDDAALARTISEACQAGLSPALHAIGDAAVARAIRLLTGHSSPVAPTRIEHASLTPPSLFAGLRSCRAYLVVQPGFLWTDVWLRDRLGPRRTRWAYAFRSLRDVGVPLAGSSDAPFDDPDPWRAMQAAVGRRDARGRSANPAPDEAIPEPEALALYSRGAHDALGDPAGGWLEPGSPADLLLLRTPNLPEALRMGVAGLRETWVGGKRVTVRVPAAGGRG